MYLALIRSELLFEDLGESVPGRGKSKWKALEAWRSLVCTKKKKKKKKKKAASELGYMDLLEPVRRSITKYFKGHVVLLLLSINTNWKQANK